MTPVGSGGQSPFGQHRPPVSARAPRHGLPPRHFDALAAGGGGAAVIAHLWDAERSHRLLLLGLLMTMAADRPDAVGPLAHLEHAWELLSAAERQSRAVTDDILLVPETGVWLQHTLRRLRGGRAPLDEDPPLWVDTGHLHLIAAASAVRTGLSFSLRLPSRAGAVWLPSLGRATLPGVSGSRAVQAGFDGDALTLRHGGETLRVPFSSRRAVPGWQPPASLALELPEGPMEVHLSDLSPYRILPADSAGQRSPSSDERADHWAELLGSAWPLLRRADPQAAEDVAACLRSIEPLPPSTPFRWHSATMGDGMGGLAASAPTGSETAGAPQFAAILTHEVQHSKLSALMHMYSLHTQENQQRLYAPWRDDPRPLRGMLHGVYAFTAVARFWRGHVLNGGAPPDEAALAHFEFALRRDQLLRVLPSLCEDPELTRLGRRLLGQLTETVSDWTDASVPKAHVIEAERAADDHAVSWRLHHLAPDPSLVAEMAHHWITGGRTGRPVPRITPWRGCPAPRLVPDPTARNLDARAVLVRMRLMEPALAKLRAAPERLGVTVEGARPADLLLVSGDVIAARELYAQEISAGPGAAPGGGAVFHSTAGAWAGLRLALDVSRAHQAAGRALLQYPELVRAVHRAIGDATGESADPVAVAAWVGRTAEAPA
ncbi:HEXXH motif domain-containing protein [Streptomyces sp. NPDC005393]|uniref:HEXXH motif domain-containing protein n=1 Tax=Streptomyces sp. NPDC005393 TaxID=3157041 RepID=UPI0033BE44F8